jgi:hypothetical protein
MKLFELYENSAIASANNLKAIAGAVNNKTSAKIVLGEQIIIMPYTDAKFVYGMYRNSIQSGTHDNFMKLLSDPTALNKIKPLSESAMPVMEANENTLRHIMSRFKHEVKNFINGDDLDTDLYHALYDYYSDHGEMPYGVAKARSGDPFEWVTMRFDSDVRDYTDAEMDPDVPELPSANLNPPALEDYSALGEAKKMKKMEEAVFDDDDWLDDKPKKAEKFWTDLKGNRHPVTTHKGSYGSEYQGDDSDDEEVKPKTSKSDVPARGRGRPSSVTSRSEEGTKVTDYSSWYHKSKRTHPERRIAGGRNKAIAVIPMGKAYAIVGEWHGEHGMVFDNVGDKITAKQIEDFKSDRGRPRTRTAAADSTPKTRGRPKKVREWIETLKFVSESKRSYQGTHGEMEIDEPEPGRKIVKRSSSSYTNSNERDRKNNSYKLNAPGGKDHDMSGSSSLDEKWSGDTKLNPEKKDMFKGKSKAELEKQLATLHKSGPHKKGSPEYTKQQELNFAIRAKSNWK